MSPAALEERAPAKINLALHVTGRRADGYHELDSLVVFVPEAADRLRLEPLPSGDKDELALEGPYCASLASDTDNLVLAALRHARARLADRSVALPALRVTLTKELPVASGIGGGSADAAATLRLVARLAATDRMTDDAMLRLLSAGAEVLGADVPVCLQGLPARMSGIGERLEPLPRIPAAPILLVNPGAPISTGAIFSALAGRFGAPLPPPTPTAFDDIFGLAKYLAQCRNDLELPARNMCPEVGTALGKLGEAGSLFSRMSGSGATVFGLFAARAACAQAAALLSRSHPEWWVRSGEIAGAPSPASLATGTDERT